jgi:hypothetical protein
MRVDLTRSDLNLGSLQRNVRSEASDSAEAFSAGATVFATPLTHCHAVAPRGPPCRASPRIGPHGRRARPPSRKLAQDREILERRADARGAGHIRTPALDQENALALSEPPCVVAKVADVEIFVCCGDSQMGLRVGSLGAMPPYDTARQNGYVRPASQPAPPGRPLGPIGSTRSSTTATGCRCAATARPSACSPAAASTGPSAIQPLPALPRRCARGLSPSMARRWSAGRMASRSSTRSTVAARSARPCCTRSIS